MSEDRRSLVLVHVATVPESLYYFLDGQARYMRERGMEVHGIASPGEMLERFANTNGASVHKVEMKRSISPLSDLRAVLSLYRIFRRIRPDIVHGHTPKGGLLAMISARVAGVPLRIYQIHGLPHVTATGLKRLILLLCEWISCQLATQVLCVSNSIRARAVADHVCSGNHSRVIGMGSINGIDTVHKFNPDRTCKADARRELGVPDHAIVIGFVGRIVRDKGINELLAAWDTLREQFPNIMLLIAGPQEGKDPVSDLLKAKVACDSRINYLGPVLSPLRCYAAMDVLALPSYREGLGLVTLEAAAMGLPVVATNVSGCIDSVLDGVTGTLVPPKDSGALAEALTRYIQDSELRRSHGRLGRHWVSSAFKQADIWNSLFIEYGGVTN
jgi:glycosyltransferase involved in cell wall biosynthesis